MKDETKIGEVYRRKTKVSTKYKSQEAPLVSKPMPSEMTYHETANKDTEAKDKIIKETIWMNLQPSLPNDAQNPGSDRKIPVTKTKKNNYAT